MRHLLPAPAFLMLVSLPLWGQCDGPEPVVMPIGSIQGAGSISPCTGKVVQTTGTVTASLSLLSGFFIQDAGDGDPATSDGIFVFQGSAAGLPKAGSIARVTGKVAEFARSGYAGTVTELDIRTSATPMAKVELLGEGRQPLPLELDPKADSDLEPLEGMFVSYPSSSAVQPANRFGEFFTMRNDRLPATGRPTPGAPGTGAPVQFGNAVRKSAKTYDFVPALSGVLHYDFGLFRFESTVDYEVEDGGLRPTAAKRDGRSSLLVASLNAERLVRSIGAAGLNRKLAKLALAIRDQLAAPDIIGVQEVEDEELLAELGRGAGDYRAVVLKGCDFSGINAGLLYHAARLSLLSAEQFQAEAPQFRNGRCTLPDGRAFQNYLFDRPPLAVRLRFGRETLTVVVNHWRSQIGETAIERLAGADYLAVQLAAAARGGPLFVLGDFNDLESSAPLLRLAEDGLLVNVSARTPWYDRYSLIFEGVAVAYDHILTDAATASRLIETGYAHYNADFAPDDSENSPVRAADHDNPWAGFR